LIVSLVSLQDVRYVPQADLLPDITPMAPSGVVLLPMETAVGLD